MKKRRRFVAPPTRLGPSKEGDLTALAPSGGLPRRPEPESTPRQHAGAPAAARRVEPTLPDRAGEDTDEAWGDAPEGDAHVLREKPPHWQ